MSVFKSSNFSPNLSEIDITKNNEFSCQVNTSGESIKAYKIQILSGNGEELVAETDCINTTVPIKNKNFLKVIGTKDALQSNLKNGKDYQWGIRTYNTTRGSTKQPNTVVCNGFLVGSTKYVIWTKNNDEIIEDRYLEIETTGPDQIFDIIGANEDDIKKPIEGEVHRERHKIEWVTKELGYNKDITKIELDDSFKYNYIDGTKFKIFKCSDQHTVNNFYVEPNDEIKSSNWVILYNTKEDADKASAAGDTPNKTTIAPRETGRKIIGYSVDTGEIRVQESFSQKPENGNAYLLFEYNNSTKAYTEKKFTDVSNIIGGEAITPKEDTFSIITNKIDSDGYQLFIQPNINIKTDNTNPNELVFNNGTRLDIVKTIDDNGTIKNTINLDTGEFNFDDETLKTFFDKKDITIDKLDNTQWLLKYLYNENSGEVPIIPKSTYTVYTDFMDSAPYCVFYARQEPKPSIMYKNTNFPNNKFVPIEDQSGNVKIKGYRDITFKTEWFTNNDNISDYDNYYLGVPIDADDYSDFYPNVKNDNNINVKYYQYTLYDASMNQITQSSEIYDSELTWSYRGFESGPFETVPNIYTINIRIVDEYGKEYNKSSSFKIYYKSETGIVPLNVSYDQNEKANKIVASSPTYVATTDDELTGKTTVNSKDIDANLDYVKIPKGEILNYTTVIDGKDPPTPIVIPRTFSYITQFQINGDFIDYIPNPSTGNGELEIMKIGYKTTKPEDEIQKYTSLILKISSFEPFYIKDNKVIKNNNLFNLRLYKENDENNPISCFNGKDYYNIQIEDEAQEFKSPNKLRFALQSKNEYQVYDGGEDHRMPVRLETGVTYLVLTKKAESIIKNGIWYDPGIYIYKNNDWELYTDEEFIYIENKSQLSELPSDIEFSFPPNCIDSSNNLQWTDENNVWIDMPNYFNDINKKALNKKWFMLYLIVNTNDDGTEDITCEIKINNNRNI